MIRNTLFTMAVVLSMVGTMSQAQGRPNLSGDWKLIPADSSAATRRPLDPNAPPSTVPIASPSATRPGRTGGGFECYESCTISQSGTTLKVHYPTPAESTRSASPTAPEELLINLNGVETKNTRLDVGSHRPDESVITAHWEAGKLLVTRKLGGGIARLEQIISLEGSELTVVTKTYVEGTTYGTDGPKAVIFKYKKQ